MDKATLQDLISRALAYANGAPMPPAPVGPMDPATQTAYRLGQQEGLMRGAVSHLEGLQAAINRLP